MAKTQNIIVLDGNTDNGPPMASVFGVKLPVNKWKEVANVIGDLQEGKADQAQMWTQGTRLKVNGVVFNKRSY